MAGSAHSLASEESFAGSDERSANCCMEVICSMKTLMRDIEATRLIWSDPVEESA
jgi:hypothetical protein